MGFHVFYHGVLLLCALLTASLTSFLSCANQIFPEAYLRYSG